MEEKADVNRVLVEISEGKKPFGRPNRRWEDYKVDLKEIRWECMNWFNLSQNRDKWQALLNTAMNIQCGEFRDELRNSKLLKKDSAL